MDLVVVTVHNAPEVVITPPTAADFERLVQSIVPRWGQHAMALAPYVAVVTNRSTRILVGYTVVMDLTRRNQTHERFLTSYVYPDAVAGITRVNSRLAET